MIDIRTNSLISAVKDAYLKIDVAQLSTDPDIYKEDMAIFRFEQGYQTMPLINDNSGMLKCILDQQALFPYNKSLKVEAENEYWTEKLLGEKYIEKAIHHIQENPFSRSCLYSFWSNDDFDSANPKGECITQLYVRERQGALEMHSHIRANDVHRCLFLDLAFIMYAHQAISDATGKPKGALYHIVDSLHVYKKSVPEFNRQKGFMLEESSVWEQGEV